MIRENDCFALKDHEDYYIANRTCYVMFYREYKKMRKEGKCGTTRCPFYKPSRANVRVGNAIYDNLAKKKEEKST